MRYFAAAMLVGSTILTPDSLAQMPDNAAMKAEQVEKLKKLAWLDGEWRGEAEIKTPGGDMKIIQTERIGPILNGEARMVEGRGYLADGKLVFNAIAVITYNSFAKKYELHSFNDGRAGIFPIQVTAEGYNWQTPAGPNASIEYVQTLKDGTWTETGSYVTKDKPARPFTVMRLRRSGPTEWPIGKPLGPK